MPDVDLGKKVGPFPLGVWLGLGGTGLAIGLYLRSRKTEGSGSSDDEAGVVEDTSGVPGVGLGAPQATYVPPNVGETQQSGGTTYATNEDWARAALTSGVALGYSVTATNSALQKWLYNSGTLSVQESSIIETLVKKLGPPPVTPSTTDVTPGPTPTPINPVTPSTKYVRLRLQPSGLKVVGRTSSTITLRVNSVPGATQYRWYMNGRNGYVTTTGPSVTIKALRPKREYAFQVLAWNPLGPTPRSGSVHGTTV